MFAGPLPGGLITEIETRFAPDEITAGSGRVVIQTGEIDQAALRALLTLIWDVGAELRAITVDHDPGLAEHGTWRRTR